MNLRKFPLDTQVLALIIIIITILNILNIIITILINIIIITIMIADVPLGNWFFCLHRP